MRIIAEHEFMILERRHAQARRDAEERLAILEHTSVAARRKFDSVVAERERQADVLRSEFNVVRTEEEQTGEAFTRVTDEWLRMKATSASQATHFFKRGQAEHARCKADLLDMIGQYNRAIT